MIQLLTEKKSLTFYDLQLTAVMENQLRVIFIYCVGNGYSHIYT